MARKKKSSAPAGQRQLRVGEEMRHALSEILREHHLADPDLAGKIITVTECASARTCAMPPRSLPLGGTETDKTVRARTAPPLFSAANWGARVKMQFTPIRFSPTRPSRKRAGSKLLHDPVVVRDLTPHKDEDDEA
jgi:ribosome-binding factor A